jgi:hypothetical protein
MSNAVQHQGFLPKELYCHFFPPSPNVGDRRGLVGPHEAPGGVRALSEHFLPAAILSESTVVGTSMMPAS